MSGNINGCTYLCTCASIDVWARMYTCMDVYLGIRVDVGSEQMTVHV